MSKTSGIEQNVKDLINMVEALTDRVLELEKRTPEIESEARQHSRKVSEFRNKANKAREEAEGNASALKELLTKSKATSTRIETVEKKVDELNASGADKLDQLSGKLRELESKRVQVDETLTKISETWERYPDLEVDIETLGTSLSTLKDRLDKTNILVSKANERKKEVDQIYYRINGTTDTDPNTGITVKVEGLKQKLESSFEHLETSFEEKKKDFQRFENTWKNKYEVLEGQFEELLPSALTKGLSNAYSKKNLAEVKSLKRHQGSFYIGIFLLIIVSLIPFGLAVYDFKNGTDLQIAVSRLPRLVIALLPLYIPLLWVAYSSNKKVNLSKRIIEEYTHKEVVSKTFAGLSKQISDLGQEEISVELRNRLLYNILEVNSENPGKLIKDYQQSDHPVTDALEKSAKFAKAIDRLEKIPGFDKVAKVMEKRAEKKLDEIEEKVNEAIEAQEDSES